MKRILEFFQQQDGYYCALQLAIIGGFLTFWAAWLYVAIKSGAIVDCPTGMVALLGAMLAAKIWKDAVDYKSQPPVV